MHRSDARPERFRAAGYLSATVALAALLAGCTSGPGGSRFTLFPEGHRLLDSAKAVRTAYAGPQPLPRELDKRVALPYVVEPGDVLIVQPADIDSPVRFPGDQPVLTDGTINLGRYGLLVAAGKTVPEIEVQARAQIDAVLKSQPPPPPDPQRNDADRRADPREVGPITVRVVTRQSKVYYVLGEVNAPGSFTLKGNETVLDGIISAGGLNDRASRKNIILSRPSPPDGCRTVLPVCYREIVQLGDTSTNYQLAAGDRIFVPTRGCMESWPGHDKKDCGPCSGPQFPCPNAGAHDPGCGYKPGPASVLPPAPTLPPAQIEAPRKE
jgi:protein involved in polysaccharide export with SLBB domain